MLFIQFRKVYGRIEGTSYLAPNIEWEVGKKLDYRTIRHHELTGFIPSMVQASGKELEWIGRNFTGLPRANPVTNPTQRWRGDLAAFIYDHLPQSYEENQNVNHDSGTVEGTERRSILSTGGSAEEAAH